MRVCLGLPKYHVHVFPIVGGEGEGVYMCDV